MVNKNLLRANTGGKLQVPETEKNQGITAKFRDNL